jgi:hypothetical protein
MTFMTKNIFFHPDRYPTRGSSISRDEHEL